LSFQRPGKSANIDPRPCDKGGLAIRAKRAKLLLAWYEIVYRRSAQCGDSSILFASHVSVTNPVTSRDKLDLLRLRLIAT
jgi:hypothetical protein